MKTFTSEEAAYKYLTENVPWGCAAGVCRDASLALQYAEVGMTMVGYGSLTKQRRPGHSGENFYFDPDSDMSINALGLPNKGFDAYLPELIDLHADLAGMATSLWVSISAGDAFDPQEYSDMAGCLSANHAANVIEGNFSCPNVEVGGKRKPVVCFDLNDFRAGVKALTQGAGNTPTAVKIAPHTEARWLADVIEICLDHGVSYLVEANTVGNCYVEKASGESVIAMTRGGMAGAPLVPIISGMLQVSAPLVRGTNLKLIATGGVMDGKTAYQYLRLGAHGFAFNTYLYAQGGNPRSVQYLLTGTQVQRGLLSYMVEYGLPD
jgi:dihydroorotate dehydrogenase